MGGILLTDEEIEVYCHYPAMTVDEVDLDGLIKAQAVKLVEWLNERKRNTYLPLEEPCEWVAFSLEDWQALRREVLGEG